LISASQKARVRLSFERVHDNKTEKDTWTATQAQRRLQPAAPKLARARSSDAREITYKPMLLGYARSATR
jgi:hypothetical protein